MQFVIAAAIGALLYAVTSIVGRVLIALGIGYVTYTGVGNLGTWIMDTMKGALSGLPADAAAFLAFLWIDKALTMVFSAWL